MSPTLFSYEEELGRNLSLSHRILFHTSRRRLLTSRSYAIALRATLSLTRSIPFFRRSASLPRHLAAVAMLDTSLRLARSRAAKRTLSVPLAQDVYAMLCHFLGISEEDETDPDLVLVTAGAPQRKKILGLKRDKRRLGTSLSFVNVSAPSSDGGSEALLTKGFPELDKKGGLRASLGYEIEDSVKGRGWTLGKSVTSMETYLVDGN
eukprot:GFKZ01014722.1.p1 GENE.GFKZ01014722.1~~GFKZ01014722.1.p1  ORF type:complete len:207 (-),score=17.24 GFKZ01014722.1:666-1286(-)